MAKGLQLILRIYIGAETPWWITIFAKKWHNLLPKSEVKHCQSRKFGQLIPTLIN